MIRAGCSYFVLVFALGFVLGSLRHVFMGFGFDRNLLVAAEIPLMLVFAWWAAGWCASRFGVLPSLAIRLGMGAIMLVLLRLAELGVGIFLMEQTTSDHIAGLVSASGLIEAAPQLLTALFPLIRGRLTGR